MIHRTIESEQRSAAKVVGVFYLLMMATGIFAEFYARGPLIVPGDAVQTAGNIATSERLFRIGAVSNLITFAGDVVLLWALYVVLKPINRNLALLAAFWRVAECSVLALVILNDFAALRLLGGADYLREFDTGQLQALARLYVSLQADGYRIGGVLFGLGSTVFAYLWFKSRYIPRGLAAWGIFSSLLVATAILVMMVFPGLVAILTPAYYVPIMSFEIALGLWLLVKGIQAPTGE